MTTATGAPSPPPHDVYDLACLAGGPERVVDAAVVALLEAGRIRVGSGGRLTAAQLRRGHPVEGAVLDALGTRGRSVLPLRLRAAEDQRVRGIADRLRRDGLLAGRRRRRLFRRSAAPVTLTTAGRRALRRLKDQLPANRPVGGVLDVALWGSSAMADRDLRQRVFDISPAPRTGRPFRGHVTDEPVAYPAHL